MSDLGNSESSVVDPLQFDTLIAAFQNPEALRPSFSRPGTSRDLSENTLTGLLHGSKTEDSLSSLQKLIEDYPQPSLIVTQAGQIVAVNQSAHSAFDLEVSDHIDDCGMQAVEDAKLSRIISRAITSSDDQSQTHFCRSTYLEADRPIVLAIVPHLCSSATDKSALVFFVDIGWDGAIEKYISLAYDLTNSEQGILEAFILGKTLEQIAAARDRSLQTVRKQFYSALKKCDFSSQADLIREVVAGSMFQSLTPKVLVKSDHPHRKELTMLRPNGRTLEVIASGDLAGTPVFLTASFGIQKFPPRKTKQLYDAGICVYTISPPGYGGTSPHPAQTDRMACFGQDVAFVLDQLHLLTVPFVAVGASLLPTIRLAQTIPDRISGIQSFITVPPTRYQRKAGVAGKISVGAAVGNAILLAPKFKNLLARSSVRAWSILGARKMAKIHSQSEPAVTPFLLDPDALQAADEGFKSAIRQGFTQAFIDAEEVFSDWYDDAVACPVPVTLVHGQNDKTTSIESVRDFARDMPDKITLVEVADGGSFLHITHDQVYIDRLLDFSTKHPATPMT